MYVVSAFLADRSPTRDYSDRAIPCDALLHPVAALAVVVLVFNDHVGKAMWPGAVTGKLSDFAGLAFFPLLLVGLWEAGLWVSHRWHGPTVTPIVVATIATGTVFMLVKATALGALAWAGTLGAGRWLVGSLVAGVAGAASPALVPVIVVRDPTDLVALPAILVAVWIGTRRAVAHGRLEPDELGSEAPR